LALAWGVIQGILPAVNGDLVSWPRRAIHRCARAVLFGIPLLQACGSDDSTSPAPPPAAVPNIKQIDVAATSARNVRITWKPEADAQIGIQRRGPGDTGFAEVGRRAGSHGRFLDLALDPGQRYSYRLVACIADTCGTPSAAFDVTTPASELPPMHVTVPATGTADDIVVFGTYLVSETVFEEGHMAAVDRAGRIVWEYATHELGPVTEIQPLGDGTIATAQFWYLVQLDLDGTERFRWTGSAVHHDIDQLDDGRFAVLFFDRFESPPGYMRLGDGIQVLDAGGGLVSWQWRARDHIPLSDINEADMLDEVYGLGHDWTHSNAITFLHDATKVLLNVRNLNRMYMIDVASGEPDWVMGDGGDFGAGLWDHAHDPQILDDRHIMLFDNGLMRPDPKFSRVIEIEFEPANKRASIVWEYRETPDFVSLALGSAQTQDNGNIFITDGINGRLLEVDRDKQKRWEMQVAGGYWIYKAVPVPRTFFTEW
jgi:hypothetical protein